MGIEAYLIKPISRTDLLKAVATLVSHLHHEGDLITRETVAGGGRLRILVAEDNAVNQVVAQGMLESRGHEVDVAEDGREAIELVQAGSYDLILMDVQMPGMDGIEATEALRQDDRFADLPIIALTAHALPEERDRCLAAGMNDFLSKPFKPHELFALVEAFAAPRDAPPDRATENTAATAGAGAGQGAGEGAAPPVALDAFRAVMRDAGIEAVVDTTIGVFLEESPGRAERLATAVAEGDAAGIAATAHSMKSAARNIRADGLGDLLEELERAGKADDLEQCRDLAPGVQRAFDDVIHYLGERGY